MKRATNWSHSSSQEKIEACGRPQSQDRGASVRARGSQFAMALSSRPVTWMERRNSSGTPASLYRGGSADLNFMGHCTRRRLGVKAGQPTVLLYASGRHDRKAVPAMKVAERGRSMVDGEAKL